MFLQGQFVLSFALIEYHLTFLENRIDSAQTHGQIYPEQAVEVKNRLRQAASTHRNQLQHTFRIGSFQAAAG